MILRNASTTDNVQHGKTFDRQGIIAYSDAMATHIPIGKKWEVEERDDDQGE